MEDRAVDRQFESLCAKLADLERRMNPECQNLHFAVDIRTSPGDFVSLAHLSTEAIESTRAHWETFHRNPYAGRMFWYNFMLLVSAAANSSTPQRRVGNVNEDALLRLLTVLVDVSECMVQGGDSAKRNFEAVGNILLAFPDETLRTFVLERAARSEHIDVMRFIDDVLERVRSIEGNREDDEEK